MSYIIIKYADAGWNKSKHPRASAYSGYSCMRTGVPQGKIYEEINEEAKEDLRKLIEFNPSVGFGFVEVEQTDES